MDAMNLSVVGRTIDRVSFDYAIEFLISDGATVRLESTFSLTINNQSQIFVRPEQPGVAARPIIELIGEVVAHASVSQDSGTLHLRLSNEASLSVPADKSYEAWTFTDRDGSRVVALPGGGIAVWQSASKTRGVLPFDS
jgi:hypothetical protein